MERGARRRIPWITARCGNVRISFRWATGTCFGIRIHDLAGEIGARFRAGRGFRLRLRSEKGERFEEIVYDPQKKDAELSVNGITGALPAGSATTLRAFLDGSVLEVCANETTAITARVYSVPSTRLLVEVPERDALESVDDWGMKPISKDRLTTPA